MTPDLSVGGIFSLILHLVLKTGVLFQFNLIAHINYILITEHKNAQYREEQVFWFLTCLHVNSANCL